MGTMAGVGAVAGLAVAGVAGRRTIRKQRATIEKLTRENRKMKAELNETRSGSGTQAEAKMQQETIARLSEQKDTLQTKLEGEANEAQRLQDKLDSTQRRIFELREAWSPKRRTVRGRVLWLDSPVFLALFEKQKENCTWLIGDDHNPRNGLSEESSDTIHGIHSNFPEAQFTNSKSVHDKVASSGTLQE
eukprot:Skav229370  [mRNA]  locus=scaffold584:83344:96286:- [translate_table: standard]